MKRITLFIMLLAVFTLAPTYIDQLDADFNLGTLSNVNVTNNSVILNSSGGNYTASGTFLSQVFDIGTNPTATISWTFNSTASGTSLLVSSRTGPTLVPGGTWSAYSSSYTNSSGSLVTNPQDEFIQYRLQLATTNVSNTPTVNSVSIIYTMGNPNITIGTNSNLTNNSAGTWDFNVTVGDTANVSNVSGRWDIGGGGFGNWTTMTLSGGFYSLAITEPGAGWNSVQLQNITIEVFVNDTNNQSNVSTFTEEVDRINNAPVFTSIANQTATEGVVKVIFVAGFDPDADAVTFSSTRGNVTSISATSAQITWTPSNTEVGNVSINISITDGFATTTTTIYVNVTNVNDPPVMSALTDQTGHWGDRIIWDITVTDNDTSANLSYSVIPPLFDVVARNVSNSSLYTYYARANFTLLDPHRGWTNISFIVTDGVATDTEYATLNVTYCGDRICQTEENATTCLKDCGSEVSPPKYVVITYPERICVNETTNLTGYNASSRYVCYHEGLTHSDAAFCDTERVDVQVYHIGVDDLRTDIASLSSSDDGLMSFTPTKTGEYKLIVTKTGFISTTYYLTAHVCDSDINVTKEVVVGKRPKIQIQDRRVETPPQLESPDLTPVETSLISIILWYIIAPLLLAAFVYVGNEYYQVHKETSLWILQTRIYFVQMMETVGEYVGPIWHRLKKLLAPVLNPLNKYVVFPIRKIIGDVIGRFRR